MVKKKVKAAPADAQPEQKTKGKKATKSAAAKMSSPKVVPEVAPAKPATASPKTSPKLSPAASPKKSPLQSPSSAPAAPPGEISGKSSKKRKAQTLEAETPQKLARMVSPLHVFVGGIARKDGKDLTKEEDVRNHFEQCGEIEAWSFPFNERGVPMGFCFIKYSDEKGVQKALKLHGKVYLGKVITVKMNEDTGKPLPTERSKGKGDGKGKGKAEADKGNNRFNRPEDMGRKKRIKTLSWKERLDAKTAKQEGGKLGKNTRGKDAKNYAAKSKMAAARKAEKV